MLLEDAYELYQRNAPDADALLFLAMRKYAGAVAFMTLGYEAPDLAVDIATNAYLKLPTFKGEARISTWFYVIARNAALNVARRRTALAEVPLETVGEPEAPWHNLDTAIALDRLYVQLDDEERRIFDLHVREGCSFREIRDKLGFSSHNSVQRRWQGILEKARKTTNASSE